MPVAAVADNAAARRYDEPMKFGGAQRFRARAQAPRLPLMVLWIAGAGCSLLAPSDSDLLGGRGGSPSLGGAAGIGGTGGTTPPDAATVACGLISEPIRGENLRFWAAADDGLTSSADGVERWPARTPTGSALVQDSATQRPGAPKESSPLRTVSFDGVDDALESEPDSALVSRDGITVALLLVPRIDDAVDRDLVTLKGPDQARIAVRTSGSDILVQFGMQPPSRTGNVLVPDQPMVLIVSAGPDVGVAVNRNGHDLSTQPEAPPDMPEGMSQTFILGKGGTRAPYKGAVGEILVYDVAMPKAERQSLASYLQKRWQCCCE